MKYRPHRYDINRSKPRHRHTYWIWNVSQYDNGYIY